MRTIDYCYTLKHTQIVVSLKAHDVSQTIAANRLLADKCDCPMHLGITATGLGEYSIIKSAVGLGSLLSSGIGDTIRVSMTGDPCREVAVGYEILQSLGLRARPYEVIACPTCGRTEIGVVQLTKKVEAYLKEHAVSLPRTPYHIAVMGCVVNGPGESKQADIGISGGRGFGFIFKKGEMIKKVAEENLLEELIKQIQHD